MAAKRKLTNYNLALGNTSVIIPMWTLEKYCIQAVWSEITGSANGTIKVLQSLDETNYDQIKTLNADGEETDFQISINSTSGSASIEDKSGFTGVNMKLAVAVGSITGGTLNIYLNKK